MAAPGWYPDPAGPGSERYFDGTQWAPAWRPAAPLPTRSINHGMWWLGFFIGSIVTVLLTAGLLWPVFLVFWGIGYAGAAAGVHKANERLKRGLPARSWNGIGPKLTDKQKPSWW